MLWLSVEILGVRFRVLFSGGPYLCRLIVHCPSSDETINNLEGRAKMVKLKAAYLKDRFYQKGEVAYNIIIEH